MSPASKSKTSTPNAARSTPDMMRFEDDAEQALKEIAAVQTKLAERRADSAPAADDPAVQSPSCAIPGST